MFVIQYKREGSSDDRIFYYISGTNLRKFSSTAILNNAVKFSLVDARLNLKHFVKPILCRNTRFGSIAFKILYIK